MINPVLMKARSLPIQAILLTIKREVSLMTNNMINKLLTKDQTVKKFDQTVVGEARAGKS